MDFEVFKVGSEVLLLIFGLFMTWKNKNKSEKIKLIEEENTKLKMESVIKDSKISELEEECEDYRLLIEHMNEKSDKAARRAEETQAKMAKLNEKSDKSKSTRTFIKQLFSKSESEK